MRVLFRSLTFCFVWLRFACASGRLRVIHRLTRSVLRAARRRRVARFQSAPPLPHTQPITSATAAAACTQAIAISRPPPRRMGDNEPPLPRPPEFAARLIRACDDSNDADSSPSTSSATSSDAETIVDRPKSSGGIGANRASTAKRNDKSRSFDAAAADNDDDDDDASRWPVHAHFGARKQPKVRRVCIRAALPDRLPILLSGGAENGQLVCVGAVLQRELLDRLKPGDVLLSANKLYV